MFAAPKLSARSTRQSSTYWLSGLNVWMPPSVAEQTPAGSTRTTASSSAQNARIPGWLTVRGLARMVYPTATPPERVPAPVVKEYPLLPLPAGLPLFDSTESITQAVVELGTHAAPRAPPRLTSAGAYPTVGYAVWYVISPVVTVRTEATAEDSFAAIRARSRFGIAIAAMIRMIATTISSSISEKPFSSLISFSPQVLYFRQYCGDAPCHRR